MSSDEAIQMESSAGGGRIVNHYELFEEIGRGGMSRVYRGQRLDGEGMVAVKVIHIDEMAADFERRLRREPEVQRGLGHENIVRLLDWFRVNDEFFLVMEYVAGRSLYHLVRQEVGPLPFDRALRYFRQILPAVGHLHDLGIIHRDIKPSNIMVGWDDIAKLADFGIAKFAWQQGGTRTQKGLGTPEYMSPEQARGERLDHRTDIYSLGITLFEVLTARSPFAQQTQTPMGYAEVIRSVLESPIPDPRTFNPNIPPEAVRVIEKATAKNPADRFQDSREFLTAIEAVPVVDDAPATVVLDEAPLAAAAAAIDVVDHDSPRAPYVHEPYARAASDRYDDDAAPRGSLMRNPLVLGLLMLLVVGVGFASWYMLGTSRGSDVASVETTTASAAAVPGRTDTAIGIPASAELSTVDPNEIARRAADAFELDSRAQDVPALARLYAPSGVRYFRLASASAGDIRNDLEGFYRAIARTQRFDVEVLNARLVNDSTVESRWSIAYDRLKNDGGELAGTTVNAVTLGRQDGVWLITAQRSVSVTPARRRSVPSVPVSQRQPVTPESVSVDDRTQAPSIEVLGTGEPSPDTQQSTPQAVPPPAPQQQTPSEPPPATQPGVQRRPADNLDNWQHDSQQSDQKDDKPKKAKKIKKGDGDDGRQFDAGVWSQQARGHGHGKWRKEKDD